MHEDGSKENRYCKQVGWKEKVIHCSKWALEGFKSEVSTSQEHLISPQSLSFAVSGEVKTMGHDNSRSKLSNFQNKEVISYLNKVHYKNGKMRLLQCNPFVLLNRRGNSKSGLPMKSLGILVLNLNQRKSPPSILVLSSPKKCISLLPKKGAFKHLVYYCPFKERQKIIAKEPDSRLSRALQDFPSWRLLWETNWVEKLWTLKS